MLVALLHALANATICSQLQPCKFHFQQQASYFALQPPVLGGLVVGGLQAAVGGFDPGGASQRKRPAKVSAVLTSSAFKNAALPPNPSSNTPQ